MKKILLIEDNEADARLMQEAFKIAAPGSALHICKLADDAEALLKKHGGVKPFDIILSDLNLPGKDGKEFLTFLKNDPFLKTIPVIILSNSSYHKDKEACYALHANGYFAKPDQFKQTVRFVELIHELWLALPEKRGTVSG